MDITARGGSSLRVWELERANGYVLRMYCCRGGRNGERGGKRASELEAAAEPKSREEREGGGIEKWGGGREGKRTKGRIPHGVGTHFVGFYGNCLFRSPDSFLSLKRAPCPENAHVNSRNYQKGFFGDYPTCNLLAAFIEGEEGRSWEQSSEGGERERRGDPPPNNPGGPFSIESGEGGAFSSFYPRR